MSYPHFAYFIMKRPRLLRIFAPIAQWWANAAGYRQMGLLSDDLIPEESEIVQLALSRLTERQRYDRVFRMRRAMQLSLTHRILPKEEWTKPEEDVEYLEPLIEAIVAERKEKAALDTMVVHKKHKKH